MRRTALLLVLAAVLLATGFAAAGYASQTDNGSPGTGQIGICHHTGNSQAHEFIYITPDASGVYDGHTLDHQFDGDIIPAFSYVNAHGETISFAGQNLDTDFDGETGAELLANKCVPGVTTTTTTETTTTGTTTTTDTTTTGTTSTTPTTSTSTTTTETTTTLPPSDSTTSSTSTQETTTTAGPSPPPPAVKPPPKKLPPGPGMHLPKTPTRMFHGKPHPIVRGSG